GPATVNTYGSIQSLELFLGLKGTVLVDRHIPRNVDRSRDVTGTDGQFLHAFRCKDAALVLGRATDVKDVYLGTRRDYLKNVGQKHTILRMRGFNGEVARRIRRDARAHLPSFGFPFAPAAV